RGRSRRRRAQALRRLGRARPKARRRDQALDERPRVPGEGAAARLRRAGTARPPGADARRGRGRGARPRRQGGGGEGAGARGRARGSKLARWAAEAKRIASEILGMTLRTHQTGAAGKLVRKVWVEAGCEIERELYLGLVLDRAAEDLAIIASTEGGVEIEEVAG